MGESTAKGIVGELSGILEKKRGKWSRKKGGCKKRWGVPSKHIETSRED